MEKIEQIIELKNDINLNLIYGNQYIGFQILIRNRNPKSIFDTNVKYENRNYDRKDFISHIDQICKALNNKLKASFAKNIPVIIKGNNPLIISKILIEMNGLEFAKNTSLFSSMRGKRIFNKEFSFYQSSNPEDSMTPFFDVEGVVNHKYRYKLIGNGVIISPYSDKITAFLYNLTLSGSAIGSYDDILALGMKPFKVKGRNKV